MLHVICVQNHSPSRHIYKNVNIKIFCTLFHMGVKLGLSREEKNKGSGCLREDAEDNIWI
jgi:hypothetical protein